jgi:hypothetical protein
VFRSLYNRVRRLERRRAAAPPCGTPRLPWDAIADGGPEWAWLFERGRVEDPMEEHVNGAKGDTHAGEEG